MAAAVPMAVEVTSKTASWPIESRNTYRFAAPSAFMRPICRVRWMVHTVKNAPTISAEMARRKPLIRLIVAVSAENPGDPA